jgi:hypothetical protein
MNGCGRYTEAFIGQDTLGVEKGQNRSSCERYKGQVRRTNVLEETRRLRGGEVMPEGDMDYEALGLKIGLENYARMRA